MSAANRAAGTSSSSGIREPIRDLRARLTEGRQKIQDQFQPGTRGTQVCNRLADLIDGVLRELFDLVLQQQDDAQDLASKVALVPCGGYGRRDVVPYSDVDLILLYDPRATAQVRELSRRLVADMSDLGITLGFSTRTISQAVHLSRKDAATFTSQAESRYLTGSTPLYNKYASRLKSDAKRRSKLYVQRIEQAREAERKQYGETIYLLEPDVKRSLGGLRDIHLLRWIGFAKYGESRPSQLRLMGLLRKEEERAIRQALDFLLRLRIELHFRAGRPNDILNRFEQTRIAEDWGYTEALGLLPVQSFMRDYFFHTGQIRDVVANFVASARTRPMIKRLLSTLVTHRMEDHFLMGPVRVSASKKALHRLQGNLADVLKLMALANQANKQIDHDTWLAIREDMTTQDVEFTDEAGARFLQLLSYSARLGRMLRLLHEIKVLEKLVIGFEHARHLLQFNQYHKYTVDEHCIRAVEVATEFFSDPGPLGRAYRSLNNRWLLHLTLLIHDLGKGYDEAHSEVGRRLAIENGRRLKLTARQTDLMAFLIEKHLLMSHIAFRRDTSDEQLILQFAHEVGSPETLQMLYLLTAADVAAVGPDMLNPWKVQVLTDLYNRTMHHLGGHGPTIVPHRKVEDTRLEVRGQLPDDDFDWYARQLRGLPGAYLAEHQPEEILGDLERLHQRQPGERLAWGRHQAKTGVTEYFVAIPVTEQRGGFHRIIGAMTSHGIQIFAGACHNLPNACSFFRFYVEDQQFADEPPASRIEEVSGLIEAALSETHDACPTFQKTWSSGEAPAPSEELPVRVAFDNSTLSEFTIIDLFAIDHPSLNYKIARAVYEHGLTTWYTKTGSRRDQVVFAMYVTERDGTKVKAEQTLDDLREALLAATHP